MAYAGASDAIRPTLLATNPTNVLTKAPLSALPHFVCSDQRPKAAEASNTVQVPQVLVAVIKGVASAAVVTRPPPPRLLLIFLLLLLLLVGTPVVSFHKLNCKDGVVILITHGDDEEKEDRGPMLLQQLPPCRCCNLLVSEEEEEEEGVRVHLLSEWKGDVPEEKVRNRHARRRQEEEEEEEEAGEGEGEWGVMMLLV
jgi:hypothetical protein